MADRVMDQGKYDGDDHFGWCPECGRYDGCMNVGPTHWFYCDAHRVRWCVGWNLFDSLCHEDEATWERNAEIYGSYREVDGHEVSVALLNRMVDA